MARMLVNLGVSCWVKALSLADAMDGVADRVERETRNMNPGRQAELSINLSSCCWRLMINA